MFADKTMETGASSGTSDLTLGTSVAGWKTWRSQKADTTLVPYFAETADGSIWEMGHGTLTYGSPDKITGRVLLLSSTGALVDFGGATVYVMSVPNAAVLNGVSSGWLAASRHALTQAGAFFWTYSSLITSWTRQLATGAATEVRVGLFDVVKDAYFADGRRPWTTVGATNKTVAAADIGGNFTYDTAAAQRTVTLPARAVAKDGFTTQHLGLSSTNGLLFTPAGGDSIEGGTNGVSFAVPGGVTFDATWDGASNTWRLRRDSYKALLPLAKSIAGLTLSTAGSSTTFSIAQGYCADKNGSDVMRLASTLAKTTGAWAVGTAAGGLDTGAISNSTWYHVHAIKRIDTGVVDALISLSATAPTLPTNYTLSRRIGSVQTNGAAQWVSFQQVGDTFHRAEATDFTASGTTTATLRTLSVPVGVVVFPRVSLAVQAVNNTTSTIQLAPAGDATLLFTAALAYEGAAAAGSSNRSFGIGPPTNTSGQIYVAVPAYSTSATVSTQGWIDRRGQDE